MERDPQEGHSLSPFPFTSGAAIKETNPRLIEFCLFPVDSYGSTSIKTSFHSSAVNAPIDRLMDSESAIDGVRKEKERLTAACLFFIAAAVSFPTCPGSPRYYRLTMVDLCSNR